MGESEINVEIELCLMPDTAKTVTTHFVVDFKIYLIFNQVSNCNESLFTLQLHETHQNFGKGVSNIMVKYHFFEEETNPGCPYHVLHIKLIAIGLIVGGLCDMKWSN